MDKKLLQWHIQDVTDRYRAAGYFPSACVRVFDHRETLAVCCAGDARPESLFDVASLTKIATATQILLLADAGRLSLSDTLASCFPEIAADDYLRERLAGVTLFRLLTHTSGVAAWYPFYSRRGEEFFAVLRYALQHTAPTEGVVYSDLNFMLLGKLLERVHGMPLPACLRHHLVEPYGLGKMLYHPSPEEDIIPSDYGNRIEMDMCRERGISFDGFRPLGTPVIGTVEDGNSHYYFGDAAGHAGIFASAEAYERLCRLYMNTSSRLFREAQKEQPASPGRGLGLQIDCAYPHGCGHTGFTGTSIYFSSEYHIGAVVFTNMLYRTEPNGLSVRDFRRAVHETAFSLGATS